MNKGLLDKDEKSGIFFLKKIDEQVSRCSCRFSLLKSNPILITQVREQTCGRSLLYGGADSCEEAKRDFTPVRR